jgi:hypothetical protein
VDLTVLITVSGCLTWLGHTVACPECQAADELVLFAGTGSPEYFCGEDAEAACPAGHLIRHPLIYPDMAHQVARRHGTAAVPGWRPQLRDGWAVNEGTGDQYTMTVYRPWERAGASAGWWREHWPELTAAAGNAGQWAP